MAVGASAAVPRLFYLIGSNSTSNAGLSFTYPSGNNTMTKNLTNSSSIFTMQNQLFDSITVTGPIVFSLWLSSNKTTIVTLGLTLAGGFNVTTGQIQEDVTTAPADVNITYTPSINTLLFGSQVKFSVWANSPKGAKVTLHWGSQTRPSSVLIPLSGYAFVNNVAILDKLLRPAPNFDLQASTGNNVVLITASVVAAFGSADIQRVNLTIVGPHQISVYNQSRSGNEAFPLTQFPPFSYNFQWAYPANATEGVYQISVDLIDSQGHLASTFGGSSFFGLFKGGTPPFNFLPYAAIGGAAVVGGALVLATKRRTKRYLAPFEHFNSLTGGELNGGTMTVEGNTGSGKTLLSEQLMYEDLRRGRHCIFVATGDFPTNIRSNMKSMGLDVTGYEQSGLLSFVDAYSSEAGQESREKFSTPSLGDLTTLGMKITSSLPLDKAKGASLYLDSLVPLASKAKAETIISFVQSVGARMRGMGGKAVFTLGPSVDGAVQRQLEDMADCVVQMEAFEERGVRRRRLRIAKFRSRRHQEGWSVFAIEEGKGIIFYSKKPKT
jgi:KaiC/GvpD/RAD55 family RecA-like ATPase